MVTNLRSILRPGVDMDVLILCFALCNGLGHKHVVELLCVHVEQVRVAFELIDLGNGVQVLEARDLGVLLERLNEGEFVEVTCRDDTCVLVLVEDILCKCG